MRFTDRTQAGEVLAGLLSGYRHRPGTIVLGLARGGVIVAAPVAAALDVPLDVLVVRKLGLPWAPEVAFGAVSSFGVELRDPRATATMSLGEAESVAAAERTEADRQERVLRGDRTPPALAGRTVLLVDDGLATGATAAVAIATARGEKAARVVLAVPVGPPDMLNTLRGYADEVICPERPAGFTAVSTWYDEFEQVPDAEVAAVLANISEDRHVDEA